VTTAAVAAAGDGQSGENLGYLAFHRPRFDFILGVVSQHVRAPEPRVLDIGASPLTELLRQRTRGAVDALGLEPDATGARGRHYRFDLNDAQFRDRWRLDLGPYDVIVFAEVIEHLYTAPELVLDYLRHLLAPGGLLLLQTPNAASLRKRIKLALGQNPFERIRPDRGNPGHFREYTAAELRDLLSSSGYVVQKEWRKFYFDARYARHEAGQHVSSGLRGVVSNVVYRLLPPFLREGITILAQRAR